MNAIKSSALQVMKWLTRNSPQEFNLMEIPSISIKPTLRLFQQQMACCFTVVLHQTLTSATVCNVQQASVQGGSLSRSHAMIF
jgi:hypothetical protein